MFELVHLCAVLWVVHLDGGHAAPTLVPAAGNQSWVNFVNDKVYKFEVLLNI